MDINAALTEKNEAKKSQLDLFQAQTESLEKENDDLRNRAPKRLRESSNERPLNPSSQYNKELHDFKKEVLSILSTFKQNIAQQNIVQRGRSVSLKNDPTRNNNPKSQNNDNVQIKQAKKLTFTETVANIWPHQLKQLETLK